MFRVLANRKSWRVAAGKALFAGLILGGASCTRKPGIELHLATWGGAGSDGTFEKMVRELDAQFEARHPGVKIVNEYIPQEYVQKMLLNHVANAMPDVMMVDASTAAVFMNNGLLKDLRPKADQEHLLDQYFPNVVDAFSRGEAVYALPNDFTPIVIYYNKDVFDASGVPYPKNGWTWEDFRKTAKALTLPEKKQYGFVLKNWMPGWITFLWNNGGDMISLNPPRAEGIADSPQNAETLAFLRQIVQDGSAPTISQAAALGVDLFSSGLAAMDLSGHWSMVDYKAASKGTGFNWKRLGVVSVPTQLKTPRTVLYMSGFGIPTKSPHPDLAWEYVKMRAGYEFQHKYNQSGIAICGRKDVAAERSADPDNPVEKQFLPLIPLGIPPHGAKVEGYSVVEDIGTSMMDSVLNNGRDPMTALRAAAERIDREFAKSK